MQSFFGIAYVIADISTFVYLTFFDGYAYTYWNWPIAVAANAFLAQIWPIYWIILRPLLGH